MLGRDSYVCVSESYSFSLSHIISDYVPEGKRIDSVHKIILVSFNTMVKIKCHSHHVLS